MSGLPPGRPERGQATSHPEQSFIGAAGISPWPPAARGPAPGRCRTRQRGAELLPADTGLLGHRNPARLLPGQEGIEFRGRGHEGFRPALTQAGGIAPHTYPAALANRAAVAERSRKLAPDCRGLNFFTIDHSLRALLPLYMDAPLLAHLEPHLAELGELTGGRLGELSDAAERHQPVLHPRDRWGRDEEWIEFHPAYHAMEEIAFGRFGMHAMTHKAGVLGWPEKLPPLAKYVFHYLFAQAEFGLLCPVNLTDSSSELVRRYGDAAIRERYLEAMWSQISAGCTAAPSS